MKGELILVNIVFLILFLSVFVSAISITGKFTFNQKTPTCTDSDGGIRFNIKGTATLGNTNSTDVCYSGSGLNESYCIYNGSDYSLGFIRSYCDYGCQDGACMTTPSNYTPNQTCTDSDGGKNYYVKGSVNSSKDDVLSYGTDYCSEYYYAPDALGENQVLHYSPDALEEYYCTEGHFLGIVLYNCSYGCRDGVCLSYSNRTNSNLKLYPCTDSDKGMSYYIKGTATSSAGSIVDSCTDTGLLNETSCSPTDPYAIENTLISCPLGLGCNDGACINPLYNYTNPNESPITESITEEGNSLGCTSECSYDGRCLPYGYRIGNQYCNIKGNLVEQNKDGICDNNFECVSNVCANSECISPSFLQQVINFFKNLFGIQ